MDFKVGEQVGFLFETGGGVVRKIVNEAFDFIYYTCVLHEKIKKIKRNIARRNG